ncbi:uncharacterized protein [Macaca fascicularis]|uniref:uncharacterized protein n=1 Tax=Macaca fascicularis TaxID=9541 RepID=UPI003D1566B2
MRSWNTWPLKKTGEQRKLLQPRSRPVSSANRRSATGGDRAGAPHPSSVASGTRTPFPGRTRRFILGGRRQAAGRGGRNWQAWAEPPGSPCPGPGSQIAGPVRAGARPMEAARVLSSCSLPFPGVGARGLGAGRRRLPPREAVARAAAAARPGGSRDRGSPAQESPARRLLLPRSRCLSGRSRHQLCPRRSRSRRGGVARSSSPPDPGHRVAPESHPDAGPWGAAEIEDPREGGAHGRLQPQVVFSVSPDQVIQMSCNGDINS